MAARSPKNALSSTAQASAVPLAEPREPLQMQVALLRGINVGKAKRISMAELKALFEGLGYRAVKTLLNSGNVVFGVTQTHVADASPDTDWPAVDPKPLEQAIQAHTGVSCKVIVLTARDLKSLMAENTLLDVATDPSRLMVHVLTQPSVSASLVPLTNQAWGLEQLVLGTRVAFVWCANGILESAVVPAMARILKDNVTARNWSTMLKLREMVGDAG